MEEYSTLHTMLKDSPYEVRHLLIHSVDGSRASTLTQRISGNSTELATGTEYEMDQKAEMMIAEWAREGFHVPGKNEQGWESLGETVTLLTLMGYKVVYDPAYRDLRKGNATGAVPLKQWPGKVGKNGGGYHYAFTGTTLLAWPTIPPGHGINMKPSQEELVTTMQRIAKLQREVGPDYEFVLGR